MIHRAVETIEIPTSDAFPVRGDLYLPLSVEPTGIVVLCHGFKGYKTWGFFPYLSERLRDAGLAALSIDFAFNGTFPESPGTNASARETKNDPVSGGPRPTRYPRPDLFRNNTLGREYKDLAAVIRFIVEDGLQEYVTTPLTLGLFGHSRGGVVALLNALEHDDVAAVCTWAIPDGADIFDARQKARWRREGEIDFSDAHEGTRLSVAVRYLEELEQNHAFYDLRGRVGELRAPHLIVHGETDLAVNVTCARIIYDAEKKLNDKRLLLLRTGHTFGIQYPEPNEPEAPSEALVEAADATVEWFSRYLQRGS
ncbi:MAG: alpha/beta fold hydrolase [Candidatus Latescibacterota bacterium]|nr:MAG: alpha/beta fold hydrolase [Candidatus Latescibacterota bacterium]